jgi:hypothetical protein
MGGYADVFFKFGYKGTLYLTNHQEKVVLFSFLHFFYRKMPLIYSPPLAFFCNKKPLVNPISSRNDEGEICYIAENAATLLEY